MTTASQVRDSFNALVNTLGVTGSITAGSIAPITAGDYDNALIAGSYTVTGSMWVTVVNDRQDRQWLEQGLVQLGDLKAYVPSGALASAVDEKADFVVNSGSYHVVAFDDYELAGELVFRKAYLRTKRP